MWLIAGCLIGVAASAIVGSWMRDAWMTGAGMSWPHLLVTFVVAMLTAVLCAGIGWLVQAWYDGELIADDPNDHPIEGNDDPRGY